MRKTATILAALAASFAVAATGATAAPTLHIKPWPQAQTAALVAACTKHGQVMFCACLTQQIQEHVSYVEWKHLTTKRLMGLLDKSSRACQQYTP